MGENWNKWFAESDVSQEIKPAKGVVQDAPIFLNEQLPKLGKKVRDELNAIIHYDQHSMESILETDEDLINRLHSIPLSQLSDYVDFKVSEMRGAGEELNQKRSKGFHKAANRFQDFTVTFSRFLEAYSGIVSIVQNADSQFGNVAFATLSLLFATVKVKAEAEETIHTCILHISDRMPDFKIYERIYPDRDLGLMLSEAYRCIILFAREVTVYFQAHGIVRYMRHFNKVAQFELMEKEIRENSDRISTRCNVLLAERIDHLITNNEELHEKIDRLTRENQVLHDREDERVIKEMTRTLNLQDYRTKHTRGQLAEDQLILRDQFGSDRRRQKMDARRFLNTTDGQYWESPGRMLLLLFGRNELSSSTPHSWLSLVAVELAEGYFRANYSAAYERCTKSSTLELTLSRLIFQLLEKNPSVIRRRQDYQEIEYQISRNGDHYEKVEALRMALLHIINLHNGRVYIILDRPELCEDQPEESCAEVVTTMLSLVKETTTELKVMVVVRSERWDFEKNRKGVDGVESELFREVRLDQSLA